MSEKMGMDNPKKMSKKTDEPKMPVPGQDPEEMPDMGDHKKNENLGKHIFAKGWRSNAGSDNTSTVYLYAVGRELGGETTVFEVDADGNITQTEKSNKSPQTLAEEWEKRYGYLKNMPQHTGGGGIMNDLELGEMCEEQPNIINALFGSRYFTEPERKENKQKWLELKTIPNSKKEAMRKEADDLWLSIEQLRMNWEINKDVEKLQKDLKLIEKSIINKEVIQLGRISPGGNVLFMTGKRQIWQDKDGEIHRLGEPEE